MEEKEANEGEFKELIKYTFLGFAGGLLAAALLDKAGFSKSAIGQWLVRTLSGEGESIFEGVYAILQRFKGKQASMAEAYGWGKVLGLTVPWIIDAISRAAGVDVYGTEGFYIPYFYAMSDQIGANVSGFVYLYRQERKVYKAVRAYFKNPVMIASLAVVLLAPAGLFLARVLGFQPSTQILTAFETIAANLCWVPPLVGWIYEKKKG